MKTAYSTRSTLIDSISSLTKTTFLVTVSVLHVPDNANTILQLLVKALDAEAAKNIAMKVVLAEYVDLQDLPDVTEEQLRQKGFKFTAVSVSLDEIFSADLLVGE